MALSISRPKVSFFTQGRRLPHRHSYIIVDQCYVQYKASPSPKPKAPPILFIHGGGLSGAQWESTPDLRPGWSCLGNDQGYDTYLLDTVDNGRSARAPDHIRPDAHIEHRTAKELWTNFRFGEADKFDSRKPFNDGQFPVEHLDALVASQTSRRRTNDQAEARGIVDVLAKIGECWLIAHSHGAALVMDALGNPALRTTVLGNVKRMVLVEPGGTSSAKNLTQEIPTLVVWGDYIDDHDRWPKIMKPFKTSSAKMLRLPDLGIRGNSHFPMSDKNSDHVFKIVLDWLEK
ncbi:uncharacterized protein PV09_08927 [Verruconis gallopava]|uniref:AB hydrolase-1 domain-containing protein n=1 Tax=Verruconis gallopava TaxID=253628 RepID=A0A0D1ZY32_9PEZI|nr:uncharacterized protein PV09_08927 [Verruconis gallopava]KIV99382.1 hypothetical protein PV09_08927 [Verruconis gallopava]